MFEHQLLDGSPQRLNVLGIGVSITNMLDTLGRFDTWIQNHEKHFVCVRDVHGVMLSQEDEKLRDIHKQAGLITPDGRPLVWLGRLSGQTHMTQVCGFDLMLAVCSHSVTKNYRHFLYGAAEGVPELLKQNLQKLFPGLDVCGVYSPPFRPMTPEEDQELIQMINDAKPDIVWVGLSTPKQEYWMAQHTDSLNASVLIGVGAAFDFHAGLKQRAPHWMQISGMEWFYRLLSEPRRLWKRYLYHNPRFIILILLQLLGLYKKTL
ncbi:MAG: WecB/TagA/CpsF family glycosyltransferase [SAR324 cluster bacterium]|nr:WecB/TagA/CpsF family glycosyltransferase [SAR324 cluster bacterium]